jgi:hypothetical protein
MEVLTVPLQGLEIIKKKQKIWTPKWTTKKTKVHTPYENSWGE